MVWDVSRIGVLVRYPILVASIGLLGGCVGPDWEWGHTTADRYYFPAAEDNPHSNNSTLH